MFSRPRKTQECDVEKDFFLFLMLLSSLYFFPPFPPLFLLLFLLPLAWFSPRNARTTSVLIQPNSNNSSHLKSRKLSPHLARSAKHRPPSMWSVSLDCIGMFSGGGVETLHIIINHFEQMAEDLTPSSLSHQDTVPSCLYTGLGR